MGVGAITASVSLGCITDGFITTVSIGQCRLLGQT